MTAARSNNALQRFFGGGGAPLCRLAGKLPTVVMS